MAKRPRPDKGLLAAEKAGAAPSPATTKTLPAGVNTATDLRHAADRLTMAASRPEDFFQANDGIAQVRLPGDLAQWRKESGCCRLMMCSDASIQFHRVSKYRSQPQVDERRLWGFHEIQPATADLQNRRTRTPSTALVVCCAQGIVLKMSVCLLFRHVSHWCSSLAAGCCCTSSTSRVHTALTTCGTGADRRLAAAVLHCQEVRGPTEAVWTLGRAGRPR